MDRMGVVTSAPFDIFDEPHILLFFIAATRYATAQGLGLFPFLHFPEGIKPRTLVNYPRVTLSLPKAQDADGKTFQDVKMALDVSDTRNIVNVHGAVGRATVVIPLKAVDDGPEVEMLSGTGRSVGKICWQPDWREGEDSNIRVVRTAIKQHKDESVRKYLKHIVELKYSFTGTMEEMQLPRAFMTDLPTDDRTEQRVCRVLIMAEYLPLHMVDSVEEFKAIFLAVVRGHHAAYTTSMVLHRDISVNNIMFYRDSEGHAIGILCDWDLAKKINSEDISMDVIINDTINSKIPRSSSEPRGTAALRAAQPTMQRPLVVKETVTLLPHAEPRCRTGTGPFMSLDLLKYQQVPQHLYRHDLESFFFVLIWFIATFHPSTHTLGYIEAWLVTDFEQLGKNKADAVTELLTLTNILGQVSDEYQSVVDDWVIPLNIGVMKPLQNAYKDLTSTMEDRWAMRRAVTNPEEKITLVKGLVYEKVVAREAILTYKSFMEALGEQPDA